MENAGGDISRSGAPGYLGRIVPTAHLEPARAYGQADGLHKPPIASPHYGFIPGVAPGIPLHAGGK